MDELEKFIAKNKEKLESEVCFDKLFEIWIKCEQDLESYSQISSNSS